MLLIKLYFFELMKAIRIVVTNVTIPNTTINIEQTATIVG